MHDGLGPQVAVLKVVACPKVHVEVRVVDVVGCFDVAHYESDRGERRVGGYGED